ncbi:MAG TPA: SDR family oxidoreductase [Xanthobacteraceae bacterium]|jgi:NAD(P)-dependent dehydrogenase (short-subunit alcohol dehydrogenase family)|nr:SDR family oxidoreductase [Xanthobacteraceae bacterium]
MSAFLSELFSLKGQTAVVTGASSGIGRRMARAIALAGAETICVARRQAALDQLVGEITQAGGKAKPLVCDLSALTAFDELAADMKRAFGAPTILVNAAGVNFREPAEQISFASWNATLHLNLSVPFFLGRALLSGMIEKKGGSIINIASLQSFRAFTNGIAYGASKGGVAQLTRAMAEAWSRHGVRTNAIAPGFFPTELTQPVFGDAALAKKHADATAIGRNGELSDLDGTTVFLAAPGSAYITGQVLAVDGGYLAK